MYIHISYIHEFPLRPSFQLTSFRPRCFGSDFLGGGGPFWLGAVAPWK